MRKFVSIVFIELLCIALADKELFFKKNVKRINKEIYVITCFLSHEIKSLRINF